MEVGKRESVEHNSQNVFHLEHFWHQNVWVELQTVVEVADIFCVALKWIRKIKMEIDLLIVR
jgi:hypothetical protein